jgi:hypothetical protein
MHFDDYCHRTLSNTEDECAHLKELCERSQQDLQDLALKYSLQLQKVEELTSKLQVSRSRCFSLFELLLACNHKIVFVATFLEGGSADDIRMF